MWQSRVEIKGYSVAYFECIAVFEAPYRWNFVKGRAHMCNIDAWISNESTKRIWALPLTEVQQYDWNTWRNNPRFLHGTATCANALLLCKSASITCANFPMTWEIVYGVMFGLASVSWQYHISHCKLVAMTVVAGHDSGCYDSVWLSSAYSGSLV